MVRRPATVRIRCDGDGFAQNLLACTNPVGPVGPRVELTPEPQPETDDEEQPSGPPSTRFSASKSPPGNPGGADEPACST